MFDVQPKARRLRDGREVPFDGVASLTPLPEGKNALSSSLLRKGNGKRGAGGFASVTAFTGGSTVRDPDDFDVFRKGPGEIWDGDEEGVEGAKVRLGVHSSLLNNAGETTYFLQHQNHVSRYFSWISVMFLCEILARSLFRKQVFCIFGNSLGVRVQCTPS